MQRVLLYFPTINIPTDSWLYSALLYSDKVASIVPYYDVNDNHYSDTIKYLIDEQQYEPIFYGKFKLNGFYEPYREFEDFFIKTVESAEFQNLVNRNKSVGNHFFMDLYKAKVTDLRMVLEANDLIIQSLENKETVQVEETTALLLMSLMAQYFSKIDKDNIVIPSTDDKRYETIAFRLQQENKPSINFILSNCLPTPNLKEPIKKIVEFKRKRRDNLLEFRQYLSSVQEKIKKCESSEDVKEVQILTKETIEKEINNLSKLYKDSNIKTFFTSFSNLLNLENPKLFQTLTVAGIITTPINPLAGITSGLFGIGGEMVSSYLKAKREVEKSEFCYLFQAKKENLIL